jgi:amino acid permease
VPLTFSFQESMQQPERMISASTTALVCVALTYIVLGVGLYALFPNLTSDVLHELPPTGLLPVITRLAMIGSILATAPLLIVPCADLLEGKCHSSKTNTTVSVTTTAIPSWISHSLIRRTLARFGIVAACVMVATALPDFVDVLALVGCFCVAFVSFCVPPLLHGRLVYNRQVTKSVPHRAGIVHQRSLPIRDIMLDVALFMLGMVVTIVSTICTLRT